MLMLVCEADKVLLNMFAIAPSPASPFKSINQSINLHFLSLGLIRGVKRQYLAVYTKH